MADPCSSVDRARLSLDWQSDWCYANYQSCSGYKSWMMGVNLTRAERESTLELCGEPVHFVAGERYLGIWPQSNGRWTLQLSKSKAKASKGAAEAKAACRSGFAMLFCVNVVVVAQAEFSLSFASLSPAQVASVQASFMRPLKNACGLASSTSNAAMAALLSVKSLADLRERAIVSLWLSSLAAGHTTSAGAVAHARLADLGRRCGTGRAALSAPEPAASVPSRVNSLSCVARVLQQHDLAIHVVPFEPDAATAWSRGAGSPHGCRAVAAPPVTSWVAAGHDRPPSPASACVPLGALLPEPATPAHVKTAMMRDFAGVPADDALRILTDASGRAVRPWADVEHALAGGRGPRRRSRPLWHVLFVKHAAIASAADLGKRHALTASGPDGSAVWDHLLTGMPPLKVEFAPPVSALSPESVAALAAVRSTRAATHRALRKGDLCLDIGDPSDGFVWRIEAGGAAPRLSAWKLHRCWNGVLITPRLCHARRCVLAASFDADKSVAWTVPPPPRAACEAYRHEVETWGRTCGLSAARACSSNWLSLEGPRRAIQRLAATTKLVRCQRPHNGGAGGLCNACAPKGSTPPPPPLSRLVRLTGPSRPRGGCLRVIRNVCSCKSSPDELRGALWCRCSSHGAALYEFYVPPGGADLATALADILPETDSALALARLGRFFSRAIELGGRACAACNEQDGSLAKKLISRCVLCRVGRCCTCAKLSPLAEGIGHDGVATRLFASSQPPLSATLPNCSACVVRHHSVALPLIARPCVASSARALPLDTPRQWRTSACGRGRLPLAVRLIAEGADDLRFGFHRIPLAIDGVRVEYPVRYWDPAEAPPSFFGKGVPRVTVEVATDGSFLSRADGTALCSSGFVILNGDFDTTFRRVTLPAGAKKECYAGVRAAFCGAFVSGATGNYDSELTAICMAILAVPLSADLVLIFDCTAAAAAAGAGSPPPAAFDSDQSATESQALFEWTVLQFFKTPSASLVLFLRVLVRRRAAAGGSPIRWVHQRSHEVITKLRAHPAEPLTRYEVANGVADAAADFGMSCTNLGAPDEDSAPPRAAVFGPGAPMVVLTRSPATGGAVIKQPVRRVLERLQSERHASLLRGLRCGAVFNSPSGTDDLKRARSRLLRPGWLTRTKALLGITPCGRRRHLFYPATWPSSSCMLCSACAWDGSAIEDDMFHTLVGCPTEGSVWALADEAVKRALAPFGDRLEEAAQLMSAADKQLHEGVWRAAELRSSVLDKLSANAHSRGFQAATASRVTLRRSGALAGMSAVVLPSRFNLWLSRAQLAAQSAAGAAPLSEWTREAAASACAAACRIASAAPAPVGHAGAPCWAPVGDWLCDHLSFCEFDGLDPFNAPIGAEVWRSKAPVTELLMCDSIARGETAGRAIFLGFDRADVACPLAFHMAELASIANSRLPTRVALLVEIVRTGPPTPPSLPEAHRVGAGTCVAVIALRACGSLFALLIAASEASRRLWPLAGGELRELEVALGRFRGSEACRRMSRGARSPWQRMPWIKAVGMASCPRAILKAAQQRLDRLAPFEAGCCPASLSRLGPPNVDAACSCGAPSPACYCGSGRGPCKPLAPWRAGFLARGMPRRAAERHQLDAWELLGSASPVNSGLAATCELLRSAPRWAVGAARMDLGLLDDALSELGCPKSLVAKHRAAVINIAEEVLSARLSGSRGLVQLAERVHSALAAEDGLCRGAAASCPRLVLAESRRAADLLAETVGAAPRLAPALPRATDGPRRRARHAAEPPPIGLAVRKWPELLGRYRLLSFLEGAVGGTTPDMKAARRDKRREADLHAAELASGHLDPNVAGWGVGKEVLPTPHPPPAPPPASAAGSSAAPARAASVTASCSASSAPSPSALCGPARKGTPADAHAAPASRR